MKKIISLLMILSLCLALGACSSATISGEPKTYSNVDGSFSVDLPTSDENGWIVNEETSGNVLDIADEADTVRIQIQCMSKLQIGAIAPDLTSYSDYSITNTFSEILPKAKMTEASIQVPDFVTGSISYTYTYKGAKGAVIFMESEKCYYTYLILAVEDAYEVDESILMESVMSFKEITEAP